MPLFENQNMTTAFTLKYHISYIYIMFTAVTVLD